jgi:hypothetical protein
MLQQLVPAGRERLGDARATLADGSSTGSVYLAGYCVEMVLKHAALRTEGCRVNGLVRDALAPARARLVFLSKSGRQSAEPSACTRAGSWRCAIIRA